LNHQNTRITVSNPVRGMDFLSVGSTEVDEEDTQNFGGKPFGKCPHNTQGRRRQDNIKEQTSCEDAKWLELAQDCDQLGSKVKEVTRRHKEQLHSLHSLLDSVRAIKLRMRWAGHVACIWAIRFWSEAS
jgi:hypothetical protein